MATYRMIFAGNNNRMFLFFTMLIYRYNHHGRRHYH